MTPGGSGAGGAIWFLATGKSGLGHLRRSATIARALKRLAPEQPIGLVTNAAPGGLEAEDMACFGRLLIVERPEMCAALAGESCAAAVVDTAAIPGIEGIGAPRILVMREMPPAQESRFLPPDAAGRWDLIIVPNPRDHWMPAAAGQIARRSEAVGWIYRPTPAPAPAAREVPLVLVATGGGGKEETAGPLAAEIDAIVGEARRISRRPFEVLQAAGPRLPASGRLATADRFVDPGGELNRHFAAADVVISTVGYNSVLELASLDVPTLLVPIGRSIDDQAARAALWGPRLGAWHDGDRATSAVWLARTAEAQARRVPWPLGDSGETRAAELILGLVR